MNELITIAGTVATVQMLFAVFREWRAARRVVAVGGLDADLYAEHGCVPLQFAGSRNALVRAVVAFTGFFTVRPKTRKHAFAAVEVAGVHDSSVIDFRDVRPRDRLRVMLDKGEHSSVFDRSMRRGVLSFYRTVAIRDLGDPDSDNAACCVTVRTRGSLVREPTGRHRSWLEFEVIAAAPRGNRRSGTVQLTDIPDDAIEVLIIPPATHRSVRDAATAWRPGALRRWLMRRNPNPVVAAMHWVAKYTIPFVAVNIITALAVGSVDVSALLTSLAVPFIMIALLVVRFVLLDAFGRHVRRRVRNRRLQKGSARQEAVAPTRVTVPIQYVDISPPHVWTGATAYGMSVGRKVNANDARSVISHALWHSTGGLLPRS
ncbi:hypothetical protein [Candidatus Poriferisodalis sp.]|uniref:hypothetical protein n=1 Tax=Candidatus Poriferisodalis sp. TaxID=3101277 RepID=UPI003C6FEA79